MKQILYTYFYLTLALPGQSFQGEFLYVRHVSYQNIESVPIKI